MSTLGEMKVPDEIVEAIQATLPQGQEIRYLALVIRAGEFQLEEFFLAVTNSLVATRGLSWEWDLTPQQIKVKQDLESRKHKDALAAGMKLERKIGFQVSPEEDRIYTDAHVWNILHSQHGPIRMKWLPQVLWSRDCLAEEFGFLQYSEADCPDEIAVDFANRGHQTHQIAEADFAMNGLEFTVFTFYSDLRNIYNYLREKKMQSSSNSGGANAITKCQSCGSTDLSIRGAHLVCDYCQTKLRV